MVETVDWSKREAHMWERHKVRPTEANEALADPNSTDRRYYREGGTS